MLHIDTKISKMIDNMLNRKSSLDLIKHQILCIVLYAVHPIIYEKKLPIIVIRHYYDDTYM